ncbi:hypothetical protein D038_2670B, partial [Vibrio parahaemolyticus IDH02189]
EVMSPLRDTVRFIDYHQRDWHLTNELAKALVFEAFDRNHQNFDFPVFDSNHYALRFFSALAAINRSGSDPFALQKAQLIFH